LLTALLLWDNVSVSLEGSEAPLDPFSSHHRETVSAFLFSTALTFIVLFGAGPAKSRIRSPGCWKSGGEITGLGLAGALLCYGISAEIDSL